MYLAIDPADFEVLKLSRVILEDRLGDPRVGRVQVDVDEFWATVGHQLRGVVVGLAVVVVTQTGLVIAVNLVLKVVQYLVNQHRKRMFLV